MDNLTHGLHGLALYVLAATDPAIAGDPSRLNAVFWATAIGSQAPDFDFVIRMFKGNVAYLKHHRGVTHSVHAWLLWPTVIAAVLSIPFPGAYGLLWWWSFLGVITHVGMDLLTTYGTVAFWPFNRKRLGYDVLMIVDPVLWLFGGWGIWLWETGATPQEVLWGTVLPSGLYILLRGVIQILLRKKVKEQYAGQPVQRISVIPGFGLLRWNLVVELKERFVYGNVHLLRGLEVEGELAKLWERDQHPHHESALQSELYRVFQWFARHLFLETERGEDGQVHVRMTDLAFRFGGTFPFHARVVLSPDGKVNAEKLNEKRQAKTHNA
jgi:inner membrane protein